MKNVINFGLASAVALSLAGPANSSALIERDDVSKTIRVIGRIVYSGPAATEAIAQASTQEIQEMWSDYPTNVKIGATSYRVEFEIDHVMAGRKPLMNPESCGYNFIKIMHKASSGDRSYYSGLGSRTGVFYTSDGLGTSTTAAHEFGHGLLLDHNPGDQRSAAVPGIMFARGTIVKPEFQWDPKASAGAAGGTINPSYRKVRREDIRAIPFSILMAGASKRFICLGDGKAQKIK